jgi:GTP cyclohydrolase II
MHSICTFITKLCAPTHLQVALLLGRAVLWPDLPCNCPFLLTRMIESARAKRPAGHAGASDQPEGMDLTWAQEQWQKVRSNRSAGLGPRILRYTWVKGWSLL